MRLNRIFRRRGMFALALLAAALAPAPAAAVVNIGVSSTFDTDADGWQYVDITGLAPYTSVRPGFPAPVIYHASGGNPGGYISAQDPSDHTFFFDAPAKFLGDQSAMYGGTLRFDVKVDPAGPEWTQDSDVVLISGTRVIVYDFPANPGSAFLTRTVALNPTGWRFDNNNGGPVDETTFRSVLADLSAVRILGEFVVSTGGLYEIASLDNVALNPVPEPAQGLLMALGIAGVAAIVRRRSARAASR